MITGFILAGVIIGPSGLGLVHENLGLTLASITEVVLSLIALMIGSKIGLNTLKTIGRRVVTISLCQIVGTFLLVTTGLVMVGMRVEFAAILGTIASASAPAAVYMIISKLKAKGVFVDHLYAEMVVGDVGTILLFSAVTAVAANSLGSSYSLLQALLYSFIEILSSVLLGFIAGLILHSLTRRCRNANEIKIVSLSIIFITSAVSHTAEISPLITCLTAGATWNTMQHRNEFRLNALESLTPPLYAVFFAIAGTELNLSVLSSLTVLQFGFVFVLARVLGKVTGVFVGGSITRAESSIRKYLGISMLPLGGVAISLVLFLDTIPYFSLHQDSMALILNIVLFGVLMNKLIGPPLSNYSITRGAASEDR